MSSVKLAHWVQGSESSPQLVLVHGLFDSHRSWAGVVPRLVDAGFRVVTVDLRGHGESPATADGYAPLDLAGDVAALIRDLGLDAPVWVGHSMGARVGYFLASSPNSPLRGLVIGDIGLDPQPQGYQEVQSLLGRFPRECTDLASADAFLQATLSRGEAAYFRRCLTDTVPLRWQFNFHAVVEIVRLGRAADWIGRASQIQCPVLFVRGARSTEVTPQEAARVCAAIPDCQFVEIPGVGHDLHESRADDFARTVIDWLHAPSRTVPPAGLGS